MSGDTAVRNDLPVSENRWLLRMSVERGVGHALAATLFVPMSDGQRVGDDGGAMAGGHGQDFVDHSA